MSDHSSIYYLSTKQPIGFIVILTAARSEFWRIKSGSRYCHIVGGGRCVTDGVGIYGNYEYCEVEALQTLIMTAEQYDIEDDYDFLTVKGVQYEQSGSGPNNVPMQAGDTWTWASDDGEQKDGFTICGR